MWHTSLTGNYCLSALQSATANCPYSVLAPGEFDRASLKPSASAAARVAFPGATPVSHLPLASVSLAFGGDLMTYTTTPELLKTVAALVIPTATATVSGSTLSTGASKSATASRSAPLSEFTGGATGLPAAKGAALAGAFGIAAFLV